MLQISFKLPHLAHLVYRLATITYSPPPLGGFQLVSEPMLLILMLNILGVRSLFANLHLHLHICLLAHILFALMDNPPIFDFSRLDIWKVKMSCYLKTLGLHVFLAATKKC